MVWSSLVDTVEGTSMRNAAMDMMPAVTPFILSFFAYT